MEHEIKRSRPRRSMKLTAADMKGVESKIKELGTKYDAALFFGFSQVTLDNILLKRSAKESTVMLIREKLSSAA